VMQLTCPRRGIFDKKPKYALLLLFARRA
jgi:hypothetical protein